MIYTIGRTEFYAPLFAEDTPRPKKLGRVLSYPGGSVWETQAAAQAYLDEQGIAGEYSVYGVDADWEKDTAPRKDGATWNDLLRNGDLYQLPPIEGQVLRVK